MSRTKVVEEQKPVRGRGRPAKVVEEQKPAGNVFQFPNIIGLKKSSNNWIIQTEEGTFQVSGNVEFSATLVATATKCKIKSVELSDEVPDDDSDLNLSDDDSDEDDFGSDEDDFGSDGDALPDDDQSDDFSDDDWK